MDEQYLILQQQIVRLAAIVATMAHMDIDEVIKAVSGEASEINVKKLMLMPEKKSHSRLTKQKTS